MTCTFLLFLYQSCYSLLSVLLVGTGSAISSNMLRFHVLFILTFVGIMDEVLFNHSAAEQIIFYYCSLHFCFSIYIMNGVI